MSELNNEMNALQRAKAAERAERVERIVARPTRLSQTLRRRRIRAQRAEQIVAGATTRSRMMWDVMCDPEGFESIIRTTAAGSVLAALLAPAIVLAVSGDWLGLLENLGWVFGLVVGGSTATLLRACWLRANVRTLMTSGGEQITSGAEQIVARATTGSRTMWDVVCDPEGFESIIRTTAAGSVVVALFAPAIVLAVSGDWLGLLENFGWVFVLVVGGSTATLLRACWLRANDRHSRPPGEE